MSSRRLGLLAMVLVLTGVPAAPHATAVGEQFEGYQANGTGSAYTVFPVFPTLIPYDASIEATVSLTQATLSTGGGGFGKASTFWPGVFAGIGPLAKLLCAQCPPLPDYPIVVESREFEDPKSTSHPGVTMKTDAKSERAWAEAVASNMGTAGVFAIGSAKTVSSSVLEGSTLTSTSRASLSGITFAAGAISIDSIETLASAATDTTKAVCDQRAEVSGLTVGGQRAIVDKDGVRAAEKGEPLVPGADPNAVIAATLEASGVTMRLVDGVESCGSPQDAGATSGALHIQLPIPTPGIGIPPDSTMNVVLGSTAATVAATGASGFEEPPFVPGDTGVAPPGTPILAEAVPRIPGPTSGGGFTEPVDATMPAAPPPVAEDGGSGSGETAAVFPFDDTSAAYAFGGIPGSLVVGLLLAGVLGVRRICRYMERLFTIGAVR